MESCSVAHTGLQWAEIVLQHSSLGDRTIFHLKKKKKSFHKTNTVATNPQIRNQNPSVLFFRSGETWLLLSQPQLLLTWTYFLSGHTSCGRESATGLCLVVWLQVTLTMRFPPLPLTVFLVQGGLNIRKYWHCSIFLLLLIISLITLMVFLFVCIVSLLFIILRRGYFDLCSQSKAWMGGMATMKISIWNFGH